MQITFDPLNQKEADFVGRLLSPAVISIPKLTVFVGERFFETLRASGNAGTVISGPVEEVPNLLDPADDPSTGADAPSATPLVPAPSTAAATLFPTALAAPQASVPPAPPVPSPPVPTAPSPAPVPTANAAPVPPAGDVDSTGLPWDERIHASTKTMNADGTWRQRRGLNDPGLVKRVEAELRVMQAVITHPTNPLPGTDPVLDVAVAVAAGNVPPAPSVATAVVPPNLTLTRSGTNHSLIWPGWAKDFTLQSQADLSPADWLNVTNPPALIGYDLVVTNESVASRQFFRLKLVR